MKMRILAAIRRPELDDLLNRSLERFRYTWDPVQNGFDAFQKAITEKYDLLIFEFALDRMNALEILRRLRSLENLRIPPIIVLTQSEEERLQIEHARFPRTEILSEPLAIRNFVGLVQQTLHQRTHLVCLGGGTGLFTLLSGLKTLTGVTLSSIVSMSDDGGSTGMLRDMFGILPPGDVRRSLVALSTAPDLMNELMQYRFQRGKGLEGHNLGNLLLTALSEMHGSMTHAVRSIGEILNIQGQVIPVTETVNTLKAELENGAIIEGEHRIDLFEGHDPKIRIKRIWQEPPAQANPDALEAILNANLLLLGPGDLFTSIIPNFIAGGVAEAIVSSRAKKVYICNVMTKPGETTDFTVCDHIQEIVKYLKKDVLDYVITSSTQFSKSMLEMYAKKKQAPVIEPKPGRISKITKAHIVSADIASGTELVRHDSLKLAGEIKKILEKK